jgi:hypothetical protein
METYCYYCNCSSSKFISVYQHCRIVILYYIILCMYVCMYVVCISITTKSLIYILLSYSYRNVDVDTGWSCLGLGGQNKIQGCMRNHRTTYYHW